MALTLLVLCPFRIRTRQPRTGLIFSSDDRISSIRHSIIKIRWRGSVRFPAIFLFGTQLTLTAIITLIFSGYTVLVGRFRSIVPLVSYLTLHISMAALFARQLMYT